MMISMMVVETILVRSAGPTRFPQKVHSREINFHFVNFPTLFILSSVGQDRYPNT